MTTDQVFLKMLGPAKHMAIRSHCCGVYRRSHWKKFPLRVSLAAQRRCPSLLLLLNRDERESVAFGKLRNL